MTESTTLSTLPCELLSEIISYLPISDLLTLHTVSKRFNSAASWSVSSRFRHAEALNGHSLIFECVPPSNRTSAPSLHCIHKGSYPLNNSANTPASLYSHFIPTTSKRPPSATVTLDSSELFTQLSISALLAKPSGTHSSLYSSILELLSTRFFRLKRSWLLTAARQSSRPNSQSLIWIDDAKNFGLQVKVSQRGSSEGSESESEEEECSFDIVFEEVLVRTGVVVRSLEGADGGEGQGAFVESLMPGRGKGGSVFINMPWFYSYPWVGMTAQQQWA
ncbi:hypothetical protein RUND412_003997 [Rhizina undulata]